MIPTRVVLPILALAGTLLLPVTATHAVDARQAMPLSSFPRESITVETRSARRHVFQAWRAETPEQREQGLMFVPQMGADEAMIFVYEPEQYVAMWMKNTILPLDMLFVDGHGCVVSVKERAKPQSLDTIAADRPVALVVELNAGIVASHGIHTGDRVVRPAANWPRPANAPCTASG